MRTLFLLPLLPVPFLLGCPSSQPDNTGSYEAGPLPDGAIKHPCTLPGAVQFTANGPVVVPGGDPNLPALDYLHLPVGFCAHPYGVVGNARQMRFAPGGELFVSSPTTPTTGGNGTAGASAIVVLPDDDEDGLADKEEVFLDNLPSTQGMLFNAGNFYYQDATRIMQLPYERGDRMPSGAATPVVDITVYSNALHWPKTLDVSDDGHIYVGNGGGQEDPCVEPHPFLGGIIEIDGTPGGKQVAQGFRNPINIRCARGHNQCFAVELALDYSESMGGREKLVPIRQGDDWGFPCCATRNLPYSGVTNQKGAAPSCGGVTAESNAFIIGDTPFGIEFEPGRWAR